MYNMFSCTLLFGEKCDFQRIDLSVKNGRKLDALRELPLCRFINSVARTIKTWLNRRRRGRR